MPENARRILFRSEETSECARDGEKETERQPEVIPFQMQMRASRPCIMFTREFQNLMLMPGYHVGTTAICSRTYISRSVHKVHNNLSTSRAEIYYTYVSRHFITRHVISEGTSRSFDYLLIGARMRSRREDDYRRRERNENKDRSFEMTPSSIFVLPFVCFSFALLRNRRTRGIISYI